MSLTDFFPATVSRSGYRPAALGLTRLIDLWRSRQALARLDATALKDIGVSQRAALNEAQKPVWDVPNAWRD